MNEKLRLRPYKNCDAEYIIKWIQDEKIFFQWSADRIGQYPITAEKLNAHYEEIKDSNSFWQMTAFDADGIPRGHFIIRYTDDTLQTIRLGFVIVDDSLRGKGYGKQMLQMAIRYAFDFLQVDKITLGVFANNPGAYYCYKAAGFQEIEEEKHFEFTIGDEKWECIEMECVRR